MIDDNPKKTQVIQWLKEQQKLMNKHCEENNIKIAHIVQITGLTYPTVWKFRSSLADGMNVSNFILIADSIGYELEFKKIEK